MNVHWTESALADLSAIKATIARHSQRYAVRMVQRVFDRCTILETQPRFGAKVPEYDDENMREVFEHPYRIIYRLWPERIDVVAVVHGARRLPRGL